MLQKHSCPAGVPIRKLLVCGKAVDSRDKRQWQRDQKQLLFPSDVRVIPVRIHIRRTRLARRRCP